MAIDCPFVFLSVWLRLCVFEWCSVLWTYKVISISCLMVKSLYSSYFSTGLFLLVFFFVLAMSKFKSLKKVYLFLGQKKIFTFCWDQRKIIQSILQGFSHLRTTLLQKLRNFPLDWRADEVNTRRLDALGKEAWLGCFGGKNSRAKTQTVHVFFHVP